MQILFAVSISAAKTSILCFYRRVFAVRTVIILSLIIGALVIAWSLALIFLIVFNCKPIAYFWDKSIPGGQCINTNVMGYLLPWGHQHFYRYRRAHVADSVVGRFTHGLDEKASSGRDIYHWRVVSQDHVRAPHIF